MTEQILLWLSITSTILLIVVCTIVMISFTVILTYILARACSVAWHRTKREFMFKPNGDNSHG